MKKIILILLAVVVLGAGGYYAYGLIGGAAPEGAAPVTSGATNEDISKISTYSYTELFSEPAYGFIFKYPADFTITRIPDETSETIVVQNVATNIGVQIMISPNEGADIDITEAVIRESIPDLEIKDAQEVIIGNNRRGLAFMSDNEAFGGKSREVWFVYGGNLYQISTYAELDEFLKGLFGTWSFK